MVKMQVDLSDDEGRILEIFKLSNHFMTKQEAVKAMIKHFDVKIKPKNMSKKEYHLR